MDTTQTTAPITADDLVQDVVERHPETIVVFNRHGLHCVGCYVSLYHSITDSAREYRVGLEPLLAALNQAAAS